MGNILGGLIAISESSQGGDIITIIKSFKELRMGKVP